MNLQRSLHRATQLVAGAVTGFALVLSGAWTDDFQGATHMVPFDEDTLHYSQTRASGPVARLQERIEQGTVKLKHDDAYGYLLSLLPEPMKAHLYQRLHDILTGTDMSAEFQKIPPATRHAIREILVETKQGLPEYWKAGIK